MKQKKLKIRKPKMAINSAPENDEQQLPRKIRDLQKQFKSNKQKFNSPKPQIGAVDSSSFLNTDVGSYPKTGRNFKSVPTIQQNKGESWFNFMKRMQQVSKTVMEENKFEREYNVEVKRNECGEVTGFTKVVDKKLKNKRLKRKIRKVEIEIKKRSRKLKSKIRKNSESEDDLFTNDKFKFGEVVSQPPQLSNEKIEEKRKKLEQLKLSLNHGIKKKHDKSKEQQRLDAVMAYRKTKASKLNTNSLRSDHCE